MLPTARPKLHVDLAAADDERAGKAEAGELRRERLRLRVLRAQLVDDDDRLGLRLGGERVLQRERPHLLRQIEGMTAHDRTERLAAAAELRRRLVAVARAAGALLAVHLLRRRLDLAARLRLVRARLALGELPAHHAVQDVGARLEAEDGVGQRHRPRRFAGKRRDFEFHHASPPVSAASGRGLRAARARGSQPASARHPAASRFTASRTSSQPPFAPGTAPRTRMKP